MRIERARLSIAQGNAVQGAMLLAGVALLWLCAQPGATGVRIASMLVGYLLIYFASHASAHWFVGRLVGIRFTHYSIGGSTHAAAYPPGMRQVFERLPFFAAHVDKDSMRAASPISKALMFGAGMTGSVVLSTLAALWPWANGAPGGAILLIANCIWFVGALIAEMRQGDYARAGRALAPTLSQRERA
jgi:hypothetical protein